MHDSGRSTSGFTLVEIMVVLSIISVILVLVAPTLWKMASRGEVGREKAVIQTLKVAVKALEVSDYGDLPPTFLDAVDSRFGPEAGLTPNRVNMGIESLVVTFHGKDFVGETPFTDEDRFTNLDEDSSKKSVTVFNSRELFEYTDSWGNPFLYFRLRDFEGSVKRTTITVRVGEDEFDREEVEPVRNERLGTFAGSSDGFQIISAGPDGQYGTKDDITSF